jgi:hypothetical protein
VSEGLGFEPSRNRLTFFLNDVITWKLDSEFMGMLRKLLLASSVVPNCSFRYADVWQL